MSNDILAELARYLDMPIEYEFNAHGVMGGAIEEITRLRARVAHLERPVTEDEVRIAYSSIAQSHLIGVRAFPDALAAALEFRMRAAK